MFRTNIALGLNRVRFDWFEVLLLCAFVGIAVWKSGHLEPRITAPDAEALRSQYGPARYSQFAEEWIIRDFFQDKRGGVFVDVGANHYRTFSTTYYLEEHLGWSGLAIEPLREFESDYKKYRPNTRFLSFFVSDSSNEEARMYVLARDKFVASGDRAFTERYGSNAQEITVPTITLNDLLAAEQITEIDFLSMDIELWEPKALAGFDIDRYRPALVCVEVHEEVRQQIFDYFARHKYVVVGKYLRADDHNVYFAPLDAPAPMADQS